MGEIGKALDRVDGRLKVTGGAKYASELPITNPAYAVLVTSTIAKGRVTSMDTSAAERAPGVLKVLTPFNAPKVDVPPPRAQAGAAQGGMSSPEPHVIDRFHHPVDPNILILSNVHRNGQPIGLVDAGTYFHTDYSYLEVPARCTILYAIQMPAANSGTTCVNSTAPRASRSLPKSSRVSR